VSKLLFAMLIVLSLVAVACGDAQVLQGDVGNAGFTILRNVPARDPDAINDRLSILVKDSDFQGLFASGDEHAVITAEMENQPRWKYSETSYIVNIRLSGVDQGTQPYFVSREFFNRILVDSPLRFKVSGSPMPTIKKLLEVP